MADYRFVKCKFWSDTYIESLPGPGKTIYLWGFTNEHTTLSGIYNISKKKVSNEVGFDLETVSKFLDKFTKDGKIVYTKDNFIWFKNFLLHQPGIRSKTALTRVARELEEIRDEELIEQFLDYYSWLDIPYSKKTINKKKNERKKAKLKTPNDLTDKEREILEELKKVKNFPNDLVETVKYIRELSLEFPEVNALYEIKKKVAWWKDKPLDKNSRPHLQLRNWFEIAQKKILESKKNDKVGSTPISTSEFDDIWMPVGHYLYEQGWTQEQVWDLKLKAEKVFQKMKEEWDKSDKKPKTFMDIFYKYEKPF